MSKFCMYPWNSLLIKADGDVSTCCYGRDTLGNIKQNSIDDILKNEKIKKIRQDLLEDKWPQNCSFCKINEEKLNFFSMRYSIPEREVEIRNNPDEFKLEFLDNRWDNTCNLACNYCNPRYSSIWEKTEGKIQQTVENEYTKQFYNFVFNQLDNLLELRLYGGEPFLLKKNIELLEKIDDDVKVLVSTNLSIPNLEKNKIFNALKSKKLVYFVVSFENIGSKFEYVRYGADWELFKKNLDYILKFPNFKPTSSSAYGILTATNLEEFYDFAYNKIPIKWHGILAPVELNVHKFSKKMQDRCIDQIHKIMVKYNLENDKPLNEILRGLENAQKYSNADGLKNLHNFLINQEQKFKKPISYTELWPELCE